jgi:hypothetical protein
MTHADVIKGFEESVKKRLAKERRDAREKLKRQAWMKLQPVLRIAAQMGNICYNKGQSGAPPLLSEHDKQAMLQCCIQWDKARAALPRWMK